MTEAIQTRMERCEIHGEYRSRLHAKSGKWSRCWQCTEAKIQAMDAEAQRQDIANRAAAEVEQRLADSGLEGRMLRASFESYIAQTDAQQRVLEACREFAETVDVEGGRNLWLVGNPGTGKTHLGSAMVNHFIRERGTAAAILGAREIVLMLRATWGGNARAAAADGARSEADAIDHLGRIGLLVLDEIGAGFGSDAERVQLFDVIDLRYKLGRPTVVLSNLSSKDVKPILGERAHDRLREGARQLVCNWPSHRGGAQ